MVETWDLTLKLSCVGVPLIPRLFLTVETILHLPRTRQGRIRAAFWADRVPRSNIGLITIQSVCEN